MKKAILVLPFLICITTFAQQGSDMFCVGRYWTPDGANLQMKEFASQWNDLES